MELRRRRSRCVGLFCAVVVADLALLIGCVAGAVAQRPHAEFIQRLPSRCSWARAERWKSVAVGSAATVLTPNLSPARG
jgi:hypothetical protein